MTVSNLHIHEGLSFDEYQRLPGNSYSSLTKNNFEITDKIKLGTAVHRFLLEPQHFSGNLRLVKPLAMALKYEVGDLWQYLKHELSVTADFEHEGFSMPYRGRIDSGIKGKIVIDYKIGANVRKSMRWFNYHIPLTGYATAFETTNVFMIAITPSHKPLIDVIPVSLDTSWWEEQILLRGQPVLIS